MKFEDIKWEDLESPLGAHFKVKDALWLPSWSCAHTPSDEEKANIFHMSLVMDKIRDFIAAPIFISCWIRPTKVNCPGSEHHEGNYNLAVGSTALHSAHIVGKAVDWTSKGHTPDELRALLVPKIDEFKIRIEALDHSPWCHVDLMHVAGGHNYFKP